MVSFKGLYLQSWDARLEELATLGVYILTQRCCILACNFVIKSIRKKKNEKILALSSYEVEVDGYGIGSVDQAVLSWRLGQWPDGQEQKWKIFLAGQGCFEMWVSPQPNTSSRRFPARHTWFGSLHFRVMFSNIHEAWWAADLIEQLWNPHNSGLSLWCGWRGSWRTLCLPVSPPARDQCLPSHMWYSLEIRARGHSSLFFSFPLLR